MPAEKIQKFDFGELEYHSCYVIGRINPAVRVTTEITKTVLLSIKERFGRKKMVYISDREMGRDIDVTVYKLIDHKKMVGIALVSSNREVLVLSAGLEQAAYAGSFGVFNTLDSAISWAQSFVEEHD